MVTCPELVGRSSMLRAPAETRVIGEKIVVETTIGEDVTHAFEHGAIALLTT